MSNSEKYLFEQAGQEILPSNETPVSLLNKNEIVALFFSIDLVDFTRIKQNSRYDSWIEITKYFYQYFGEFCSKFNSENYKDPPVNSQKFRDIRGLKIWKVLGDEIILIYRIYCLPEIPLITYEIYRGVQNFENKAQDLVQNKNIKLEHTTIRTKSTAWIVNSSPIENPNNTHIYNIHYEMQKNNNNLTNFEFVGEHVDIGFRLSKHTVPHVLSLSIELYYIIKKIQLLFEEKVNPSTINNFDKEIISRNNKLTHENNTKLVGHSDLKGVGNDNLYPIIWYSENWDAVISLKYYRSGYKDNPYINNILYKNPYLVETEKDDSNNIFAGVKQTIFYENLENTYQQTLHNFNRIKLS